MSETRDEIVKLSIASVVLSMTKRKASPDCLSQTKFMQLVEPVRCTEDYKLYLLTSIREKPICLYFTTVHFANDPESFRKGTLTKTRGLFTKKKLFCVLQDQVLKIYKDQGRTDLSEEVPLQNVNVKFLPAKDKDPSRIVISSKDDKPFGSSFQKNQKKPAKKSVYEFSGAKDEELKIWVNNLIFAAIYHNLIQLMIS
jgi:hypothetical protein